MTDFHFLSTAGLRLCPGQRAVHACVAGAALLACAQAGAQANPANLTDPAAIQRQELERRNLAPATPAAQATPALSGAERPPAASPNANANAAPVPGGVSFVLRELQFGDSAFLDQAELAALANNYMGREVDFNTLNRIVEAVNALYRAQGVLTARAMLSPQRVTDGVVKINLVEARVGQVEVNGNGYTQAGFLSDMLATEAGQTLDPRVVEQRIQRFNRGAAVQIEGSLRPGASFGLTDLMLEVREPPRYQARVFANNESSQSIGREQVGVDATLNGPAGIGDRLAVYATRSRGATLGSLSYALPVNRWGGHLSATYSVSATDVIAGAYRALGISGKSKTLQLAAVQPVLQAADWWFDLAVSGGRTHSDNQIDNAALSDIVIHNQTAGGTLASNSDQRSLNFTFSATHATAYAMASAKRSFNVRQASASWVENFGNGQFALLRASAQDTNDAVLSPSLLFQLGGKGSVRGYDVGVLSGDTGYLTNLEYHVPITAAYGAYVFQDYGSVRTSGLPRQHAASLGAGLEAQWGAVRASLSAGYAHDRVVPDQRRMRVTGELSYTF